MKTYFVILVFLVSIQTALAGRFEFHANPQYPAQSILLDTQTGKIWKNNCYSETKDANGNCVIKAWAPELVIGLNATEAQVWKTAESVDKVNQDK